MGLLRVGGKQAGSEVNIDVVRSGAGDGGVRHGHALLAFADAAMQRDAALTGPARAALTEAIGEAGVVDAAAVTAMFQLNTRAADSAGVPIEDGSQENRRKLGEQLGFDPRMDGADP